jgi:hypothetical protein
LRVFLLFSAENNPVPDLLGNTVEIAPELTLINGKKFLLNIELLPKTNSKEPFPLQPLRFKLLLGPDIQLVRTD